MKNIFKKISIVALAALMAASMGTAAFAAESATGDAYTNITAFKKTLKLHDTTESGITLYAPQITYLYTVTPAAGAELSYNTQIGTNGSLNGTYQTNDSTLTDVVTVRSGSEAGAPSVTLNGAGQTEVSFSNADTIAASADSLITKDIAIAATAGSDPGVYRFKISESIGAEGNSREAAGVTQSEGYEDFRYLDVYVGYNDAETALEVKNMILFRYADGTTIKTEGWTSANDLDTYETVDVTVTKNITGSLGDKNHNFPFSFTVSDPATGSLYSYTTTDTDLISGASFANPVNAEYAAAVSLSDKETIKIYGIPVNAQIKSNVTVSEKNDTVDTYKYKATGSFTSEDSAYMAFAADTKLSAEKVTGDILAAINDLSFENNMAQISPTGVVMRFAPYALILAAGGVLLVVALKRRGRKDLDD